MPLGASQPDLVRIHRRSFLTDGEVHGAFDFVGRIDARYFLLDSSNEPELPIDGDEVQF